MQVLNSKNLPPPKQMVMSAQCHARKTMQNSPDGRGNAGAEQGTECPPDLAPKRDRSGGAMKPLRSACIGTDSRTGIATSLSAALQKILVDYRHIPDIGRLGTYCYSKLVIARIE